MTFTEDEVRDFLAVCDLPHADWQVKLLTNLLNSQGKITIGHSRRGT